MTSASTGEPPSRQALLDAVARALSGRFGRAVGVGTVTEISAPERRNLLLRCSVEPSGRDVPATVIVKHVRGDYDPARLDSWDTIRFLRELCGASFLDVPTTSGAHLPRFFGGDVELGFVLLEDLGPHHQSLVEPLLEQDAASAERALLAYVQRLARLHADGSGRLSAYDEIAHAFGPRIRDALANRHVVGVARPKALIEKLATMIEIHPDAERELHETLAMVAGPGPFRTFVHGDPCPDNVFYAGGSLRLIDLEFARPASALIDALYPRMGFPTCWCANRVPGELVTRLEAAYRKELLRACPEAGDDRVFGSALVDACGYWLFISLEWMLERALTEDERWGISGKRARILARLESFIEAVEHFQRRITLRDLAARLLDSLRDSWAEVEPLPVYPAFL
jgi:Phosphotransferase enzyme family